MSTSPSSIHSNTSSPPFTRLEPQQRRCRQVQLLLTSSPHTQKNIQHRIHPLNPPLLTLPPTLPTLLLRHALPVVRGTSGCGVTRADAQRVSFLTGYSVISLYTHTPPPFKHRHPIPMLSPPLFPITRTTLPSSSSKTAKSPSLAFSRLDPFTFFSFLLINLPFFSLSCSGV